MIEFRPSAARATKINFGGLNCCDHTVETKCRQPDNSMLFTRFTKRFVGHLAPIVFPCVLDALDFGEEIVAVIGKPGRHIAPAVALSHVVGFSICNDVLSTSASSSNGRDRWPC